MPCQQDTLQPFNSKIVKKIEDSEFVKSCDELIPNSRASWPNTWTASMPSLQRWNVKCFGRSRGHSFENFGFLWADTTTNFLSSTLMVPESRWGKCLLMISFNEFITCFHEFWIYETWIFSMKFVVSFDLFELDFHLKINFEQIKTNFVIFS